MEERVSKLESENAEVKKEVQAVAKSAKEAKSLSESLTIPQNEEEKKSFLTNLEFDWKVITTKAKVHGLKKKPGME